jgi:hypothetical protein
MIKRSLIIALVLLLGYHFILPRLGRDYFWIPGQLRANYQRAQHYVHDSPGDLKVVVGSSMANELSQEILGPGYTKLTFPAGGSFTGMEIIKASGKRPPLILIESNTLLRDADEALLADVTSSWRRQLREASPVFKEEGRPSNYQVGFLNAWIKRVCNGVTKVMNGGKKPAPVAEKPMDPKVLADVMKVNRETLNRVPDREKLAAGIRRMGELVDHFTAAGCECVFFEMPIDTTLDELAEPTAVRDAMKARFPADKYRWLEFNRSRYYQTSDGIHLTRPEADDVTRKIVSAGQNAK